MLNNNSTLYSWKHSNILAIIKIAIVCTLLQYAVIEKIVIPLSRRNTLLWIHMPVTITTFENKFETY